MQRYRRVIHENLEILLRTFTGRRDVVFLARADQSGDSAGSAIREP
jgi:hypothetical protein